MNNAKVSIIIPIFNAEKYIKRLISNLLEIDYENLEIILVNDGSTDHSAVLIKEQIEKHIQFKYFEHRTSLGVSAARNLGINKMSGEFVTFIDADDLVPTTYVKTLMLGMNDTTSISAAEMEGDNTLECCGNVVGADGFVFLFQKLQGYVCNKLYRSKILKKKQLKFDENLLVGEDLKFNFDYYQALKTKYCLSFVNKKNYTYTDNRNSATHENSFIFYRDLSKVDNYILSQTNSKKIQVHLSYYFVYFYLKQRALNDKMSFKISNRKLINRIKKMNGSLKQWITVIYWAFRVLM